MRQFSTLTITAAFVLFVACTFSTAAAAQKRPPAVKKKPARPPAAAPAPTPAVNLSAEAAPVAEQLKLVARFVYVYGKIANDLEIGQEQARRGELSAAAAATNRRSREAVVTNISDLRIGLDKLINGFRAQPRLQVQYLKLSYAAEAGAEAEQLAAASRFDEAGKALVSLVERLTDALLSWR